MENNSSILRKVIVTLFVVLCFILQCSVFNSLALGGIIPNLMIILTSSFGFMRGEKEGLLIGFFSGLLCDIFFGRVFRFLCHDHDVHRIYKWEILQNLLSGGY
mgnify:CR=1 FL=1